MSIKYMSKVWSIEELEPNSKLVLLALCDNANDEGLCYPSLETITAKTSLSKPTVIKTIKKIEDAGLLLKHQRAKKNGGRYSSLYLVFPAETLDNLDKEYAEKFSQSKKALPYSQSKTALPPDGTQSKTALPEPSLTLFNHHLFNLMNNEEKETYLEYVALRKKMKLITTMSTHNSLLKKYFDFGRNIEVMRKAIVSNWRDFYEIKAVRQTNGNGSKTAQSKIDVSMDTYDRVQALKAQKNAFIDGEVLP